MSEMNEAGSPSTGREQRSRLIDHFKRAYQIVVGLAIAQACGKVFAEGKFDFADPALLLFCIFFITVVPIFHGGDRSLDLKYLGAQPTRLRDQAAYVWDVYVLLITAILFVKIAQAIPGPGLVFLGSSATKSPRLFYDWMAAMLFFDVVVLIIDWIKSGLLKSRAWGELQVYGIWIALNGVLGAACLWVPDFHLETEVVGIIVFGAALLRTILDYFFGRRFMFP
jgi:hypothetical protein